MSLPRLNEFVKPVIGSTRFSTVVYKLDARGNRSSWTCWARIKSLKRAVIFTEEVDSVKIMIERNCKQLSRMTCARRKRCGAKKRVVGFKLNLVNRGNLIIHHKGVELSSNKCGKLLFAADRQQSSR